MRRYGQDCDLAQALDLVGDRWTLLVIRELLLGERHYKELLSALPGMGTNLLATRLQDLSAHGILSKNPGRKAAYRLTARGEALRPTIYELIRWRSLIAGTPDTEALCQPQWKLLTLQALLRHPPPKRLKAAINLLIDGQRFHVRAENGQVTVDLETDPQITTEVTTSEAGFRKLCTSGDDSQVTIRGSTKSAQSILRLWHMT